MPHALASGPLLARHLCPSTEHPPRGARKREHTRSPPATLRSRARSLAHAPDAPGASLARARPRCARDVRRIDRQVWLRECVLQPRPQDAAAREATLRHTHAGERPTPPHVPGHTRAHPPAQRPSEGRPGGPEGLGHGAPIARRRLGKAQRGCPLPVFRRHGDGEGGGGEAALIGVPGAGTLARGQTWSPSPSSPPPPLARSQAPPAASRARPRNESQRRTHPEDGGGVRAPAPHLAGATAPRRLGPASRPDLTPHRPPPPLRSRALDAARERGCTIQTDKSFHRNRLESSSTGSSIPAASSKPVPLAVVSLDRGEGQWESHESIHARH